MRLIDADALKEYFQSLAYDDWNQGVSTSWSDAYRECADMVEDMPTIEPERETGKWIYQDDDLFDNWKCDKCEGLITDWGRDALPKFCPNCGAKMEGEITDE